MESMLKTKKQGFRRTFQKRGRRFACRRFGARGAYDSFCAQSRRERSRRVRRRKTCVQTRLEQERNRRNS